MSLRAHCDKRSCIVVSILDRLGRLKRSYDLTRPNAFDVFTFFQSSVYRPVGFGHLQDHRADVKPGDCGNVRTVRGELRIVIPGPKVQGARPDVACRPSRAS